MVGSDSNRGCLSACNRSCEDHRAMLGNQTYEDRFNSSRAVPGTDFKVRTAPQSEDNCEPLTAKSLSRTHHKRLDCRSVIINRTKRREHLDLSLYLCNKRAKKTWENEMMGYDAVSQTRDAGDTRRHDETNLGHPWHLPSSVASGGWSGSRLGDIEGFPPPARLISLGIRARPKAGPRRRVAFCYMISPAGPRGYLCVPLWIIPGNECNAPLLILFICGKSG